MIKINHINGDEKFVTLGAYENFFKPLGYKPVVEKTQEIKKEETGIKSFEEKKETKDVKEIKTETKDKRK